MLTQLLYQSNDVNKNVLVHLSEPVDADGRLSAYPIGSDTRVLSYDLASRITGFGQTNPVYNRSFSYDPEDRLQSYQDNLGSQTYRYDPTGNRTGIDYNATAYLYTIATTSNRLTKVAGPVVKTYLSTTPQATPPAMASLPLPGMRPTA